MNRADRKRRALRTGLRATSPIVAVGAQDAMTACLIERHGFDAVWVSGLGVATMTHAIPDLNLVTMTEALAAARLADAATSLPVIADCDNGFGSLSTWFARSVSTNVLASQRSASRTTCSPSGTASIPGTRSGI